VIGSGLGLGSERDKKRHVSPAHDLVLLSLKTLSYLSVPSGRLILLIKVRSYVAVRDLKGRI